MSGARRVRNEGEGLGWEEWATRFRYLRYNNKKNLIDPEKPWKVEKNIIIPFDVLEVFSVCVVIYIKLSEIAG
jgi:hypothetical protein